MPPRTLPPRSVRTFPQLIRWLADEYHGGVVLAIAGKTGVSPGLVNFWVKGNVGEPKLGSIERLCEAYDLEFDYVRGLIRGRAIPPAAGASGAAAMPPVGPSEPLVADPAPAPPCVVNQRNTRDIMSRSGRPIHHLWGSTRTLSHYLCLEIRRSMALDRLGLRAA